MPLFEGGIITERARDLLPEGFRRNLPPRVHDSGRIFRTIDGLEELYETKGSGAAPEMLRREMGLMYVHDLEATLSRQLTTQDAVRVEATAGAANTTATVPFSFPEDHVLSTIMFEGLTPANVDWIRLAIQPFGDPDLVVLGFALGADLVTLTGLASYVVPTMVDGTIPYFGKRRTDYLLAMRTNAGGAGGARVHLTVNEAPQGVRIAR